jgi:excisionase family DNA binding protein
MSTEIEPEPGIARGRRDARPRRPPRGVALYRIEEAAYQLRVSITTVRRLVSSGKLPYRRIAGVMRFAPHDLDALVAAAAECRAAPDSPEHKAARGRAKGLEIDPRWMADLDDAPRKRLGRGGR